MIELSTIRDLVAIFGVLAGFSYYVLTVRANQRNQQLTLETRQAQLFMKIYTAYSSKEIPEAYGEMMTWEWKDFDEFTKKYYNRKSLDVINKWSAYVNGLGIFLMIS